MGIRADSPDGIKKVLTDAVKRWANESFYVISGNTGAEASAEFARLESLFAWTLYDLGAARIDPAELGIPKP